MSKVSIERVTAPDPVLAQWRALYQQGGDHGFFLSPGWMNAWLETTLPETRLYAISMDHDGAIQLLAVLGLQRHRRPFGLGAREMRLQETGDSDQDAIYIEYNDFLTAPSAPTDIRKRALKALIAEFAQADSFVFRNISSVMRDAVREVAEEAGLALSVFHDQPTYFIDLKKIRDVGGGGEGAVLQALKPSLRSKIRRSIKRYEERGPVRLVAADTDKKRATAWENFVALHARVWRDRGKQSVFDNPKLSRFHEALRRTAPEQIDLLQLYAGETLIGALYNFSDGRCSMNYQSGFLYENDNQLAPGFVTHVMAAQHFVDAGYDRYDFLAGDADYKKRLGEPGERLATYVLERPTLRAAVRNRIKQLMSPRGAA